MTSGAEPAATEVGAKALVLVGPMGAGKTSLGRKVAKLLGVGFYDSDVAVARQHGPIPEIFREHGEAHFRGVERDAVRAGLATGGVVALGGGAILDEDTRRDLKEHLVVHLTVQTRVVAGRLQGTSRPLLQEEDPVAVWERIRDERAPLYDEVADIAFDTSSGPLQEIAAAIAEWARDAGGTAAASAAQPDEPEPADEPAPAGKENDE